ncbi:MAG TPA: alpha/beta fold hydrolase [Pilimelia sp.]|nr:alpha/beta fold hydrolase [Pilimelia sp.]
MDKPINGRVVGSRLSARRRWLPWHPHVGADPGGPLLVYSFPHAGGAANSYLALSRSATAVVVCPVELPGRATRFGEPLGTDLRGLVADFVAAVFADGHPQPFALFGHSMGAALAYETARQLTAAGGPPPRCLLVSGARPPGSALAKKVDGASDEALADLVRLVQGTPAEVIANAALMDLMLPVLQADMRMLTEYQRSSPQLLTCAVRAYGGAEDELAAPDWIRRWRGLTTGPFQDRIFPGGHFFLHDHRAEVLADLAAVARGIDG